MRDLIDLCEAAAIDAISDADLFQFLMSGDRDICRTFRRQFNTKAQFDNGARDLFDHYASSREKIRSTLDHLADGPLKLYRGVGQKFLPKRAVGKHWTTNIHFAAESYGPTVLMIDAISEQVDWLGTLARGIFFWENENEITLKRGSTVTATVIKSNVKKPLGSFHFSEWEAGQQVVGQFALTI